MTMKTYAGIAALIFLMAAPAFTQDTATLTGRVVDPTGAVVIAAAVTVVNTATNVETTTVSNQEGLYRVPALRPGVYRVMVTAAGFKRFVRENVDLRVGAIQAINASLELGAVADTVEVTTAVPLLETESSSTGTIVEGDFFYRMPLYQRWAKSIMYLTPGVTVSGNGWGGDLGGFSINGGSSGDIGYFEDGIYGVKPTGGWTTDTIQNTIDEIKVLTTVLPAEYGHSAGGAITIVKKSGTNQLHGLVSDLFRERPMQHRRFMQIETFKQAGTQLHFHQPDANISGPVYIPKLYDGRDKTFFMVAGQWLIERQGEQISYSVPTDAELNGDFSFAGSPASIYPIYDPRTTRKIDGKWYRDPYTNNLIPKSTWDPVATKFLSNPVWAKPDRTGTAGSTGYSDNLIAPRQKTVDFFNYTARVDHQLTQSIKTFVNWTYNTQTSWQPNPSIVNDYYNSASRTTFSGQTTSGVGATWVPAPTVVSESRFSYYRFKSDATWPGFGEDYGALLGIPNIGVGSLPGVTGIPSISNPSTDVQETFNLKEDVSKLSGTHAFKMGYELMRLRRNQYSISNNAGSFSLAATNGLNTNGSSISRTGGNSLTQLMSGAVSGYTITANLLSTLPRNWIHGLYLQDDWKIRPNLTANLGVRWQVQSTPNNKYGQQSSFDPTLPDNVVPGAMGVITHPGEIHKKDWNNFQPRIGMAWHASARWVVRAGYAVSTVDTRLPNPPTNEYGSITGRIDTPSGEHAPLFQLSQGPLASLLVWPVVRADGSIPYASTNYSSRSATWVDFDRTSPYSMNWNFSVQRELSPNYLVELTYSGNRGVNGNENWTINNQPYDWAWNLLQTDPATFSAMEGNTQAYRPFTNFGSITYQTNGSNSVYHGGTVKLEKRYSYGLSFLTYYTYQKAMSASTGSRYLDRNAYYRARTGGDRTHQYVGSVNYELPIGRGRRWMNRGGVLNALIGGFDTVIVFRLSSGNPGTFGFSGSPYKYMPGIIDQRGGRPNSTGEMAHLRDGWYDLGGDRFTRGNQNKMIESMDYFTYPDAYTMGNVGGNTMDRQRFIDNEFSASKEVNFGERYTFQFRFDFQNPLKFYNIGTPDMRVNFASPARFGTVSTSTSAEATTASGGGQPLMNITLALRW